MSWEVFLTIIAVASIVFNISAIFIALRALSNGTYSNYLRIRTAHLEQVKRIEDRLRRGFHDN